MHQKKVSWNFVFSFVFLLSNFLPLRGDNTSESNNQWIFPQEAKFLKVSAYINNIEYQFILDTGNNYTVIDDSLVPDKVKAAGRVKLLEEDLDFPIYQGYDISLRFANELQLIDGFIRTQDFSELRQNLDKDIYGIIGADIFFKYSWFFDCGQRIKCTKKRTDKTLVHEYKVTFHNSFPNYNSCGILGFIPSYAQIFYLDTGSSYDVSIQPLMFEDIMSIGYISNVKYTKSANSRYDITEEKIGNLKSLEVGGHTFRNVIVKCSNKISTPTIGIFFFKKNKIYLDVKEKTIEFSPIILK